MTSLMDTMPKAQLCHLRRGPGTCAGLSNNDICGGYDAESSTMSFKEMAQHFMMVCQIMTTAIDTVPKARLCH